MRKVFITSAKFAVLRVLLLPPPTQYFMFLMLNIPINVPLRGELTWEKLACSSLFLGLWLCIVFPHVLFFKKRKYKYLYNYF